LHHGYRRLDVVALFYCHYVVFGFESYFHKFQLLTLKPNNVPDLTPIVALTSAFAVRVLNAG
jgi:hypothetical protein